MRSGLQKPGTVPFLALVLFSLLSLMSALAKEWEWDLGLDFYSVHLAYHYLGLGLGTGFGFGAPRSGYDGRYSSSRLRNASIDNRSRQAHSHPHSHPHAQRLTTTSPCKSWLLGDFYSSCVERDTVVPPHQSVMRTPPRSSFEAGPGDDEITYAAAAPATKEQHQQHQQSSMSLTRGVSAFKEFVIRRWDDQHQHQHQQTNTMQLQSAHSAAQRDFVDAVAVSTFVPTVVEAVAAVPSGDDGRLSGGSEVDASESNSNEDSMLFRIPFLLRETWQRVCHVGGWHLEILRSTVGFNTSLIYRPAPATNGEHTNSDSTEKTHPPNDSAEPQQDLTHHHIPSPNQPASTAGQSKDAAGPRRDSEHMRGSSMAIVIGLVVGIMWF
ncbi:hypothetical protein BJY00DRAFT_154721 [Aspergillus carlsbadensis]|nr:hypothetical protein BJY00DRAFT_154721 [Aspergillus carlsbadensis]